MYAAVKGGETAVRNSRKLLAKARRGPETIPEITPEQIENQLGLALDRVMAEGSLYDKKAAAKAIQQSQGDLVEAGFLVRAFRATLKRFGNSKPVNTEKMKVLRRISGAFKDIPGGQILGPTYDYTHRLIDFEDEPDHPQSLPEDQGTTEPVVTEYEASMPRVVDLLIQQGLMNSGPGELIGEKTEDLTRQPLKLPAKRSIRLQALARGDEGFLLGSAYSLQRGFGLDHHPFLGELRVGYVEVMVTPPELGFAVKVGEIKVTECFMISRYIISPSPIPKFDNPKLHQSQALHLFGAGREKRIYAVPPYTDVVSLDFEDYPFEQDTREESCAICGSTTSFLDEIITDDKGSRFFVCSDTEYCRNHRQGEG